jgi:hypothetical protein
VIVAPSGTCSRFHPQAAHSSDRRLL